MRKIIAIAVLTLMLLPAMAAAAPKGELPYGAQTRLTVDYDKFLDVYYISPNRALIGSATNRPRVTLDMQRTSKSKGLFMLVVHISKDWVYINHGVFLIDGIRYETPILDLFGSFVLHDVFDGYCYEYLFFTSSNPAVATIIEAIKKAGVAGVVEYKFYGDNGTSSGVMSEGEKQVWIDMLDYYEYFDLPQIF